MSIQAVSWVLESSPARGTDRLVLISLANHAGTSPVNGAWESWPGVDTIAREAGLDRTRTVQESLSRLITGGSVERVINGAPDDRIRGDRRPNLYRLLTRGDVSAHPANDGPFENENESHGMTGDGTPQNDPPDPRDDATVHPDGMPQDDTPPANPDDPRGDASASNGVTPDDTTGCRETAPEPSVEPSLEPNDVGAEVHDIRRPDVDSLCDLLALRVGAHREAPPPPISKSWRRDMRLLLDRGPKDQATPTPLSPRKVESTIHFIFDRLADAGASGFCWADQVRSPGALRKHWHAMATVAQRLKSSPRDTTDQYASASYRGGSPWG